MTDPRPHEPRPSAQPGSAPHPLRIAVIGTSAVAAEVISYLRSVHGQLELAEAPWDVDTGQDDAGEGDLEAAILFLAPLPPSRAVRRIDELLERTGGPLLVLVSHAWSDASVRMLYHAGASAVFEWPLEREQLSDLLTLFFNARATQGVTEDALSHVVELELRQRVRDADRVEVEVRADGTAELHGAVDSPRQVEEVTHAVQGTPGVERVRTEGLVVQPLRVADHRIQSSADRLIATVVTYPGALRVQSRKGRLVLAGTIASKTQGQQLKAVLRQIPGVGALDDLLVIDEEQARAAHEHAELLVERLEGLGVRRPRVQSLNHVVVISGVVGRDEEADHIQETLERRPDVERVVNELQVRPAADELA